MINRKSSREEITTAFCWLLQSPLGVAPQRCPYPRLQLQRSKLNFKNARRKIYYITIFRKSNNFDEKRENVSQHAPERWLNYKIKTYNTLNIKLCSYIVSRSWAHAKSERVAMRYAVNVRTIGGQHTGWQLESWITLACRRTEDLRQIQSDDSYFSRRERRG